MKNIIKKTFSNMVWWSGVVTVGVMFGVVLQFVSAWVEPTQAPPNGNVTGPINTSSVEQRKEGGLRVLSLFTEGFKMPTNAISGYVLTAKDGEGNAEWRAVPSSSNPPTPTPVASGLYGYGCYNCGGSSGGLTVSPVTGCFAGGGTCKSGYTPVQLGAVPDAQNDLNGMTCSCI